MSSTSIIKSIVRLLLMMLVIASTICSCKDKTQTYLLQDNMIRLNQQNEILRDITQEQQKKLDELLHRNGCADHNGYLKIYVAELNQNMDHFLEKIMDAKKNRASYDSQMMFTYYTGYQNILKQIKDSFNNRLRLDIDRNGFMHLDKNGFITKYCNATDSLTKQNQLLLLETDALLNHHALLKSIYWHEAPDICDFSSIHAMAFTTKYIYKKGDTLDITTLIAEYAKNFEGQAIIEGKNVQPKEGIFNYSRIITEGPGLYKVPIKITWFNKSNNEDTFPAMVYFKVQ